MKIFYLQKPTFFNEIDFPNSGVQVIKVFVQRVFYRIPEKFFILPSAKSSIITEKGKFYYNEKIVLQFNLF